VWCGHRHIGIFDAKKRVWADICKLSNAAALETVLKLHARQNTEAVIAAAAPPSPLSVSFTEQYPFGAKEDVRNKMPDFRLQTIDCEAIIV
jgi:hypothetical protein